MATSKQLEAPRMTGQKVKRLLTINGRPSVICATILQAARSIGVDIPTLCYHPSLTANAVCRLCAV
jgi:NADH dehydrogenase/NADH:ubiquinone oxidoreductase subunit G